MNDSHLVIIVFILLLLIGYLIIRLKNSGEHFGLDR